VQSRIRENWILDQLEREHEAEWIKEKILLKETIIANYLDRKRIAEHMTDMSDRFDWLKEFAIGSPKPFMSAEAKLLHGSGGLINVWKNMAKNGTLAAIQERMRKLYEAYMQHQDE
jgi:hypothetical protein